MMPLFFLLQLGGCCLLYLTHRHQGWRQSSLVPSPWRWAGLLSTALALSCALRTMSGATALFAWLLVGMLAFSILPFFSLILRKTS
jgi:hypothetical protein